MNEKLIKMFGYFIAAFVALIIIMFIISSCTSRKHTYLDYENKMISVAKTYYKTNKDKLPNDDGETKKLTLKNLVNDELIDEAKDYLDNDDVTCDGSITVTNNDGYYLYTPNLNCKNGKEKYQTELLINKITENVVTEGIGLYEVNGEYVFKGDTVNNYLIINGESYRIISINPDDSIRVVKENGVTETMWDDIYNPDYEYESGLNEYVHNGLNSNIKDLIEKEYENYNEDTKAYIKTQSLCIGKRSREDITKDGSTECAVKMDNQKFGLLTAYEYLRASLDTNCSYTTDTNCQNYNWFTTLNNGRTIWLITTNSSDSKTAYVVAKTLFTKTCSSFANLNVVFNIDNKVTYSTGDGSKENPYVIGYSEE